jgi:hypothetical protein
MAEGVDGLLRDKTRTPGKLPLPAATVQGVWNDDTRASAATMCATQARRSQAAPTTSASVVVSPMEREKLMGSYSIAARAVADARRPGRRM